MNPALRQHFDIAQCDSSGPGVHEPAGDPVDPLVVLIRDTELVEVDRSKLSIVNLPR